MGLVKALSVSGHVVTGSHHGEAFQKLSEVEKEGPIESGYVDSETGHFLSEEWCLKDIVMVRHAEANEYGITQEGEHQARSLACLIISLRLENYQLYTSPYHRCIQTARVLENQFGPARTDSRLGERRYQENTDIFHDRLEGLLNDLPKKVILVSHCDIIATVVHLITGEHVDFPIPNASLTYCNCHKIVWKGRTA